MTLAQIVWTAAVLLFLVLELLTPSTLIAIWLMAGAIVALLVSIICPVVWVQVLVFLVVSIAALAITRPLIAKRVKPNFVPTNADAVIGMQAKVTAAIRPNEPGRVYVNGLSWAACADEELAEGEWCTVQAIAGSTVTVSKTAEVSPQEPVQV